MNDQRVYKLAGTVAGQTWETVKGLESISRYTFGRAILDQKSRNIHLFST